MKLSVYLFIYLFSQFVQVLLLWFFLSIIALCRVIAPVKRWCYKITDVCPSVCQNDVKSSTAHLFLLICFLKRQSFFFLTFQTCDLKNSLYFWKSIRVLMEAILKKCQINVSMILLSKWRFKAVDTRFNSLKKIKGKINILLPSLCFQIFNTQF